MYLYYSIVYAPIYVEELTLESNRDNTIHLI